ncbi:MAG: TIR domain-containing protein [Candidatus Lokiarchaeota archaeon]|nr:TIR domain-containing protein [Candidatus Lokiarchaeota archaeon]
MSKKNFCIDEENMSEKGLLKQFKPHNRAIYSVCVTPDLKNLITGSIDRTVKVWQLQNGDLVHELKGHEEEVNCVNISPDGQKIISGSEDETLKLWSIDSGKVLRNLEDHKGGIFSACFSYDNKYVISGAEDKAVRIWDWNAKKTVYSLTEHETGINSVVISPNGRIIASADQKCIKLWKWRQSESYLTIEGHQFAVNSLDFSPKGDILISGSMDKTIRIWDVISGKELKRFEGHNGSINCIDISDDAKYIASASGDNFVKIWNIAKGEEVNSFKHGTYVQSTSFLPGTHIIAAADHHGYVKIWDPLDECLSLESILNPQEEQKTIISEEQKAKTTVFISYATIDSRKFDIPRISKLLTSTYSDISEVLYWEENMLDDILVYMNDNIGRADVLIVFCSENSLKSDAVRNEWMVGYKMKKLIIPVFEKEADIPPLLTTKLGVQYTPKDFKGFVQRLYQLINKKIKAKK